MDDKHSIPFEKVISNLANKIKDGNTALVLIGLILLASLGHLYPEVRLPVVIAITIIVLAFIYKIIKTTWRDENER